jgi:hypothetical protein
MARGVVVRGRGIYGPRARLLPLILVVIAIGTLAAASLMLWADSRSGSGDVRGAQGDTSGSVPVSSRRVGASEPNKDPLELARPDGTADASDRSFRFATNLYENHVAGYSFRYPDQWDLQRKQTVSKLTRPDQHLIVSFGLGPKGGLPVAYDKFVSLLDDAYTNVTVDKVNATKIGDSVGVVIKGAATGSDGVRVRFVATVIERPGNRRAIGALAATDLSSVQFPPVVREILSSFQPL